MSAPLTTSDSVKAFTFPAMIAGVAAVVSTTGFSADSILIGIVRNTLGGTAGVPATRVITPSAAGASSVWGIGLLSSNAADTSVYTVYWLDDAQSSSYYTTWVSPAAQAVGQLFAP